MKFKLFTYYDDVNLRIAIHDFLKDPLIKVEQTHFSTSTESEIVDNGRIIFHVKYSVAIFYQEVEREEETCTLEREPEDEEERIERQAQEHLEAAARHRDDPMF